MYVGWLHQTTNVLHADQVGFVSKIVAGADVCASRPAGHPLPCFKAGAIVEGRTTAGVATDASVWGLASVASSESGHTGRGIGVEVNNNQGSIPVPSTDYITNLLNSRHQVGIMILAGGLYQGHVGLEIDSVGSANKWIRALSLPQHGWTHRALESGDATDAISAAQSGIIAVQGIDTATTYLARAPSGGTGSAFRLLNYPQSADLAKIQNDGIFWSSVGFRTQGATFFEIYNNSTPTKAAAFGLQAPGTGLGNNLTLSAYDGTTWTKKLEFVDGANQMVVGNAFSVLWGSGAPAGGCSAGFYVRTGMGAGVPGLYVCENSVWVAK